MPDAALISHAVCPHTPYAPTRRVPPAAQTQELPSLLIPLALWSTAPSLMPWRNRALLLMFVLHYAHR